MEQMEENNFNISEVQEKMVLPHPWRRLFARGIDISIYQIIWMCFQYFVLRWQPVENMFVTLLINYIVILMTIFIEPLLLCTWGTTPGKAIFGLILRNSNNKKLSYREALHRTFGVISYGYGYGIPIYNIVCMYKCRKASLNGQTMEWDWDYECHINYQIKDTNTIRTVIFILVNILIVAVISVIIMQAQMPLHRGNITPNEYVENINDILKRPNMSRGYKMNEQGEWVDNPDEKILYLEFIKFCQKHEMTVENKIVTGVRFEVETDEKMVHNPALQKLYMMLGFFAAQKEVNCFDLSFNDQVDKIINSMEDLTIELCGMRITQKLEYSGYILVSDLLLSEHDNENAQNCKIIFSIEKL